MSDHILFIEMKGKETDFVEECFYFSFLWAQVACVAALLLSAVGGARVHSGVALAADHLVAVIFLCQHTERRLNDATTQTKDQMESRLLLDVVVRESSAIFQLLTSEDQSLLVRRNAFFVLDFGLDIFDSVGGLDFQSDRLSRQSLDENLHCDRFGFC